MKHIEIINKKIKEHESIINQVNQDLEKIKSELVVKDKSKQEQEIKFFLLKKVVLKDKMIFHEAALRVLKDLLEELN
jgi:hypothetical protein